jgi:hypothetical protein
VIQVRRGLREIRVRQANRVLLAWMGFRGLREIRVLLA